MVKVVKIWQGFPIERHPSYHYIGRECGVHQASIFYNPFHLGKDGDRKEVLRKFTAYWYAPERAWLRREALRLIHSYDILACWCHPLDCHGHIIAGYVNWKISETELGLFL